MTSRFMAAEAASICWNSAVLPITRAASRNSLRRWVRGWVGVGGGLSGLGVGCTCGRKRRWVGGQEHR